jgi:hypothetical protein
MFIQASTRHLALLATLTLAFGLLAVSSSQAAVKSFGGSQVEVSWMSPADVPPDGCGTDGDPDNPTVDHPQTTGNSLPGGVVVVEQPRVFGFGDGGDAANWWSRLLQLIGIR